LKLTFELDFDALWHGIKGIARGFHVEHFLLIYFAVHMLQIAFPSDGSMIFDEAHYVPASIATLNGIAANAEHPPLSKIISAIGIALLGNNWFGWRFPQVLMQVAFLYVFYLIARRLLRDPWALGATVLLGLDTVFFIHGGALLIDMAMFLFGFLSVELYFRKHYVWSAASMGLAFASREMSIFLFATLAIYHIYANRRSLKPALKIGLAFTLVALVVFGGLMFAYDLKYQPAQSTTVTSVLSTNVVLNASGQAITTIIITSESTSNVVIWNPIQHLLFIYHYHGPQGIVINESYAPYQFAWNWILPFDPVPYGRYIQPPDPFNSPTYYRVDVDITTDGATTHYTPIWYQAQANLALWYGFWPALVALGYGLIPRKPEEENAAPHKDPSDDRTHEQSTIPHISQAGLGTRGVALFILSGIILNYVPWLTLSILVRRIGFNYYMIYTLPFIAMGLAFAWKLLPQRIGKIAMLLNLLLALGFFVWFFPVHPMP
jgi:dolichyl-phosphate-mannose--protein O-mannosyl transferase